MSTVQISSPAYDLTALRGQFEVVRNGLTYLNHAGMSPLSIPVKSAMIHRIEAMAAGGTLAFEDMGEAAETLLPQRIADLVNATPEEVCLTQSTSTGLNLIAQSLPLESGDEVLLCDVEFPSNAYPWMNLERKRVKAVLVPSREGGLSLEALDGARTARTRVVAVSAVQFFTGRCEDMQALGRYCADHHIWLVADTTQAVGVVPIDMQAMGIDALAMTAQKALAGPPGQGFMVIRQELIEQMQPIAVGALSVEGWEHWLRYEMTPRPGAQRFMMGTTAHVAMAGLLATIDMLNGLGIENIAAWVRHLSNVAIADLSDRGYEVITPAQPERHANIVTFAWPGNPQQAVSALKKQGIIVVSHVDSDGKPHIRMSSHCYNTEEDVLSVGKVLEGVPHEQQH